MFYHLWIYEEIIQEMRTQFLFRFLRNLKDKLYKTLISYNMYIIHWPLAFIWGKTKLPFILLNYYFIIMFYNVGLPSCNFDLSSIFLHAMKLWSLVLGKSQNVFLIFELAEIGFHSSACETKQWSEHGGFVLPPSWH